MIEIVERETFMSNLTLYAVCHNCSSFFHIVIRRIMMENVEREIFIPNLTLYTVYHMTEIVVCRNRIL